MPDTPIPASHAIPDIQDPFDLFALWMADAEATEPNDPNAMTVATCTPEGRPSARIVLLKGYDRDGFVFYTNKQGRKGGELIANPHAALLFHWKTRQRQIRIEGAVLHVTDDEADAYYQTRARISRLGAWASDQSRPLASRAELERRVAELEARHPTEDIPRPPHWSGFRVVPHAFEFWQDMPFRLHDRRVYTPEGNTWATAALFP